MPHNIKNKRILIKTYLFESGLFYLAKSLGDVLSENNEVFYIPKEKYKRVEGRHGFSSFYSEPKDPELCSTISLIPSRVTMEEAVDKNKIDIIISFETFMPKAQWALKLKRRSKVRIIDIPMPEWSIGRYIDNNSYKIFDEIWCLTDTSLRTFNKYRKRRKVSWDYVDRKLFKQTIDKSKRDCFTI